MGVRGRCPGTQSRGSPVPAWMVASAFPEDADRHCSRLSNGGRSLFARRRACGGGGHSWRREERGSLSNRWFRRDHGVQCSVPASGGEPLAANVCAWYGNCAVAQPAPRTLVRHEFRSHRFHRCRCIPYAGTRHRAGGGGAGPGIACLVATADRGFEQRCSGFFGLNGGSND